MRLYESAGSPTDVTVRAHRPFASAELTDLLEESSRPADISDGAIRLSIEPFEIVTLRAQFEGAPRPAEEAIRPVPAVEPAQPVFADYWRHNKGPAPIGYQPVSVQIRPSRVEVSGPFDLPITVASERTDEAVEGAVVVDVPPGWEASSSEQPISARAGCASGDRGECVARRCRARAVLRRRPDRRWRTGPRGRRGRRRPTGGGTAAHRRRRNGRAHWRWRSSGPSRPPASIATGRHSGDDGDDVPIDELLAELLDRRIAVAPGERARLRVSLRNCVASEIRGEAQVISPYDTWGFIHPWSQGFAVPAGKDAVVELSVAPPEGTPPGSWWALVKVMYFGRLVYTESIPVEVGAPREHLTMADPLQIRGPRVAAVHGLAIAPGRRKARRRAGLRRPVDLGPSLPHPWRRARPELRGLYDARRVGRGDPARDARSHGDSEPAAQPGDAGQGGHDARSHERRSSDPGHRSRLEHRRVRGVRCRARRVDGGADRLAGRGCRPDASDVRRAGGDGGPALPSRAVRNDPPPIHRRLPILIGGKGKRKTLRTVARYADLWATFGELDVVRDAEATLRRWCDDVGRDRPTSAMCSAPRRASCATRKPRPDWSPGRSGGTTGAGRALGRHGPPRGWPRNSLLRGGRLPRVLPGHAPTVRRRDPRPVHRRGPPDAPVRKWVAPGVSVELVLSSILAASRSSKSRMPLPRSMGTRWICISSSNLAFRYCLMMFAPPRMPSWSLPRLD